ncbi:SAM-dependent methyltransferase [Silvimonas amylolytica]|uniref:Cyclopropane-fatty-acyl-phospholipid synthase n=1 Tax=Silvimonas amylolytica TaxID=449663 RepID=A0ABQ2PRB4_9NEIS|nr:cyclopropane-fatty-acyl-phospholipid synthase family protein [Silvimonas amylolytica]GGP27494.1 cyclopropane-fatty-acyl-phospholipid synthase [Silvimonas amylolytica]
MPWNNLFEDFLGRMRSHGIPLRLQLWNGKHFDLHPEPRVTLIANTAGSLRHVINPTLDTLGKAYVEGEIDLEGHVLDVVDIATQLAAAEGDDTRTTPRAGRHSRESDKNAIGYHYDVSNEFYSAWLDKEMVYSCGYFRTESDTLDQAQIQKIDHILNKINIQPGQTLLDIGCGWGALMVRAVKQYGARAVGVTLSQNQYEYARERIAREGIADRCEVRLQDYRDVTGQFDRITSVGMFEHVGLKNLESYFRRIHTLLADGGVVMNHGITSTDVNSGDTPFGGGDFIDRYVFPDGELPHIALTLKEMCAAGLEPMDVENLRRHYALTLKHWAERFEAHSEHMRKLAGEQKYRIWRVYLAGCAYGFIHDWISLNQIVAVKAGGPGMNRLPLTREYMYTGR